MKKSVILIIIVILIIAGIIVYQKFLKTDPLTMPSTTSNLISEKEEGKLVSVVVENLDTPWALAFLPNGNMLITERNGRLSLLSDNNITKIADIIDAKESGEGGLMGVALHPDFSSNNYIYLYFTFSSSENKTLNRVVRFNLSDNNLANEKIIIDNIPGAIFHDGGRIKFGPDGYLYVTTGDARNSSLAQDKNSLAGKLLRVKDDGEIPQDNPFGDEVYSFGHRNSQGITWDNQNNLWSTEHGRSGITSGLDEINLIEIGKNYGWPEIQGDEIRPGMVTPVLNSGPNTTWAPSGIEFYNDKLYFVGLKGEILYEYEISSGNLTEHFVGDFGRLREVILGPDKMLYITTSNRDGRGDVQIGDDKIIRINPELL